MSPRFNLQSLLLFTLLLGCGLGWWFRPFTIEEHWPNGEIKLQQRLRRNWNGQFVTCGQQRWCWGNGQVARRGISFDHPIAPARGQIELTMPLTDEQNFDDSGNSLPDGSITIHCFYGVDIYGNRVDPAESPSDSFPETPHD